MSFDSHLNEDDLYDRVPDHMLNSEDLAEGPTFEKTPSRKKKNKGKHARDSWEAKHRKFDDWK